MKNFNYQMPSGGGSTQGIKTSSRTSSRSSMQEPVMTQNTKYYTGSGSSAQA